MRPVRVVVSKIVNKMYVILYLLHCVFVSVNNTFKMTFAKEGRGQVSCGASLDGSDFM